MHGSSNSFENFLCLHTVVHMLFRSLLYSRSRRRRLTEEEVVYSRSSTEEVGVRYLCKWPLMWWLEEGLKSSQKTEFLPSFWYILLAVHSSFLLVSKSEARWACLLHKCAYGDVYEAPVLTISSISRSWRTEQLILLDRSINFCYIDVNQNYWGEWYQVEQVNTLLKRMLN